MKNKKKEESVIIMNGRESLEKKEEAISYHKIILFNYNEIYSKDKKICESCNFVFETVDELLLHTQDWYLLYLEEKNET